MNLRTTPIHKILARFGVRFAACADCGTLTRRPRFCTDACSDRYRQRVHYYRHKQGKLKPRKLISLPEHPACRSTMMMDLR